MHEPALVKRWPVLMPAWNIIRPFVQAIAGFLEDDGLMLAGHLSFITLLAFFPFLIFLVALAGFLGRTDAGSELVTVMFNVMPPMVKQGLEGPIMEVLNQPRGDLLTIGILFTIWTAGSGLEAVRHVLNRAHGAVEHRPLWRRRATSLSFVVLFAGLIVIGLTLLVVGPVAFTYVQELMDLPKGWSIAFVGVRFGVTSIIFMLIVVVLYQVLPARRLKLRHTFPGAALTIFLWMVAASAFSRYLSVVGGYEVTYGSLGGIIIALLFFYVIGAIFILGAEFNAALAHIYADRHAAKAQKHEP
ncbi:MAG: YihY/virulence factor BrkB family protein [Alphaproteobacteria bacterium]